MFTYLLNGALVSCWWWCRAHREPCDKYWRPWLSYCAFTGGQRQPYDEESRQLLLNATRTSSQFSACTVLILRVQVLLHHSLMRCWIGTKMVCVILLIRTFVCFLC